LPPDVDTWHERIMAYAVTQRWLTLGEVSTPTR
jgi:hypothetical protein